jgi:serine/threonine-protein kinase
MSTNPPQRLGKYELQTRLGQGGMAEVWKAIDPQLKRYVAIKFMHAQLSSDPDFRVRFEREGQAIASLRHPNIVQVYDFQISPPSSEGPMAYMVMDYVVGQTLADYIGNTSAAGKFPSDNQLLRLFTPICLAIDYAHEHGIIHRDIKPANILLDSRNTRYNPMGEPILTDFGIVKISGAATLTATGMSLGTPLYISPEQVQGHPGNEKSDIYTLGVMLYEMCTGSPPFRGGSPYSIMIQHIQTPPPPARSFNPRITPALEDFLARCLAKDPEARFPNAASMAAGFAQAVNLPIPEALRYSASSITPEDQPTFLSHGTDLATARAEVNTPTGVARPTDLAILGPEASTPPAGIQATEMATLRDEASPPSPLSYAPPRSPRTAIPATPPVGGAPAVAPPPVPTPPHPPVRQRRGLFVIVTAIVLVVLLGGGVGAFFFFNSKPSIVGHAVFTSSHQLDAQGVPALNDGLQINLQNIPAPASGNSYYAWLRNSETEAQSIYLGVLSLNNGAASLTYSDQNHRDLLAMMGNFLVTEEPANITPNNPTLDKTKWRYVAALPQTPSPTDHFSYLDHVRHLLSGEPALDKLGLHGGIGFWFLNHVQAVQSETVVVRDHANLGTVRQQLANILYYLDGPCAARELSNAPAAYRAPENGIIAHATQIGLLDCSQAPLPGHVTHIGNHLTGIVNAPGAPTNQVQRANEINNNLNYVTKWLKQLRSDDLKLAAMDDATLQSAHPLRADIALQANNVASGAIDPTTQASVPSAMQITDDMEQLATFDVMPFKG